MVKVHRLEARGLHNSCCVWRVKVAACGACNAGGHRVRGRLGLVQRVGKLCLEAVEAREVVGGQQRPDDRQQLLLALSRVQHAAKRHAEPGNRLMLL